MFHKLTNVKKHATLSNAVLLFVVLTVTCVPLLSVWALSEFLNMTIPKSAGAVGSVGTLIAVTLGGIFAIYQFRLFRHHEPHLSVTQSVAHHSVSEDYVAIVVTAKLKNSSKVEVKIRESLFRLQQFDRFSNEEVEALYLETFVKRKHSQLQWRTLDAIRRTWLVGEITVEPGESHTETYEFIVGKHYRSVMVYSMFYNPHSSSDDKDRIGWHATSVYSMDNVHEEAK